MEKAREMLSYTFNSRAFIEAVIERGTQEKFQLELNATDFTVVVQILSYLADYSYVNHKDIPTIPGYGNETIEAIQDWAQAFLSSVADSLTIEGV